MASTSVPQPRDRGVPPPTATFQVTTTAEASVVVAAGEIDVAFTDRLAALLDRELRLHPPALVFDAAAVTFCAARVFTVLLDAVADAAVIEVPFAVAGRRRSLLRPIFALGLDEVLPVHRSAEEALAWLALLPQLTERHSC